MFFVTQTLSDWLKLHPSLEPIVVRCSNCGFDLRTTVPFIERGYVGLMVQECMCGKNENKADVRVTTSEESYRRWKTAIDNYSEAGKP